MFRSDPVGLPGLAILALGLLIGTVALLAARARRTGDEVEAAGRRSGASTLGVLVQGLGMGIAGFGPVRVLLDPLGGAALGEAAAVAVLLAVALSLFAWAARTMGRNWSIRARTLADHRLVQEGPFRHLRHPIYVALALTTVALAVAMGHTRQLLVALPIFALGTWLRVRSEEAMLRQMFGPAYDAYAGRVKRFVPGLF